MPPKTPASQTRDVSPPPSKRRMTALTTNKAVANFFKPVSEKEPERVTFRTVENSVITAHYDHADSPPSARPVKFAAFDLDSTLIATKSGLKFASHAGDWKWWHASVPARLKQLHAQGIVIVVVSNQGAISLNSSDKSKTLKQDMKSLSNFKGRVSGVLNALDLPISVYAATEKDRFRKPRVGMWETVLRDRGLDGDGDVDLAGSVFVGDAAGRAEDRMAKRLKDHSSSDRDFASNVGIDFKTPEEFFLDEAPRPFTRTFEPADFLDGGTLVETNTTNSSFEKKYAVELVLFCGSPGAGKSSWYWNHLQPLGYERVNQDILKTREKCIRVAREQLQDKNSVVVDNTNADVGTREQWIALARSMNVPIRLVHFTAPTKLCEHNNTVRALGDKTVNPESRQLLPKMAFTGYASRYHRPTMDEGYADFTEVGFKFAGTDEQKARWRKYWLS